MFLVTAFDLKVYSQCSILEFPGVVVLLTSEAHVVYYMRKCTSLMLGNSATIAL